MSTNKPQTTNVVEAAGGVLWKETSSSTKLAIIHRKRYGDWSLPKGKRETGESWEETALREVWEETGCQAKLGKFIGSTTYLVNQYNTPKVVLFWNMHIKFEIKFHPNDEVDDLKWVTPKRALKLLNYKGERDIVNKATR